MTDGGVTWRAGGIIWAESGTPNEALVWLPDTEYQKDELMIPPYSTGYYYRSTSSGTSQVGDFPLTWRSGTTYNLGERVVSIRFNGRFFEVIDAGTSGSGEPSWPGEDGEVIDGNVTWQEVADGDIRWERAGSILERPSGGPTLINNYEAVLNDNLLAHLADRPLRYGSGFTLEEAVFIKFEGGVETPVVIGDERNMLKVTITSTESAESLTLIFTIR